MDDNFSFLKINQIHIFVLLIGETSSMDRFKETVHPKENIL